MDKTLTKENRGWKYGTGRNGTGRESKGICKQMTACDKGKKVSWWFLILGEWKLLTERDKTGKELLGEVRFLSMLNFIWLKESMWQCRTTTQRATAPHSMNKTS